MTTSQRVHEFDMFIEKNRVSWNADGINVYTLICSYNKMLLQIGFV